MDLLFKRYASPFVLLQQMLDAGVFADFVVDFIKIINEETEEKAKWELYLHSSFLSQSYNDFNSAIESNKPAASHEVFTDEYVDATKAKSRNILKKFNMN